MNPLMHSDCPALLTLRMYWSGIRVKFLYKIVSDLPGERDWVGCSGESFSTGL